MMNPLIPMFAITGKADNNCIIAEMENIKAVGIDRVMIYARSGLEIVYMSEDWLCACETVIKTAQRLKMKVWIYDDYNWPSGSCKHAVEKVNSDFIAKRFVFENNTLSVKKLEPNDSGMVFEPFITDLLNPDAVDCFINITHEVYFKRFEKYFGSVIEGFFTDEPSFVYTATQENTFPYYSGIEKDYFNACGRNLESDMISFFSGEVLETFPSVFYDVLGKRFEKCFFEKIGNWCYLHGVEFTGHAMCDDNIGSNIKTTGNWFNALKHLTVPGVDNITSEVNGFYDFPYACLEALRRNGKNSAMDELFALGPDSMTFAKRANVIWHNAAFGINKFFIAITHLDARGNLEKNSYFNHFGFANPNFCGMKLLAEEAQKAVDFAEKKPNAKINIRYTYDETLSSMNSKCESKVQENILKLISFLNSKQICWQILTDTETTYSLPTICPKFNGFKIESTNLLLDFDSVKNWTEQQIKPAALVYDENGELAKNVFLREYTDGSVIVLDTASAKARNLTLKRKGKEDFFFTLETDGVCIIESTAKTENNKSFSNEFYPINITVSRENDNLIRCFFNENGEFGFSLEKDTFITVNKRAIGDAEFSLTLDGAPLCFSEPCAALTHCFNPLYCAAKPVKLLRGEHLIKTHGKAPDLAFLPLAVLSGDFEKTNGTRHYFFNKLNVSFDLIVPENCDAVCIMDDNNLYTTFKINGETVEEKILPPFNYALPPKFFGKTVKATLTYHSSLAPIFGDSAYVKDLIQIDWCKSCSTVPESVDISKIKIFKK